MRMFSTFPEAFAELKRDLAEMGTQIQTATVQDKKLAGVTDEYDTVELQNYVYTVTRPRFEDLKPFQPWADAEWKERRAGAEGLSMNPGEAWKLRHEDDGDRITWEDFLEIDGVPRPTHADAAAHRDEAMRMHNDPNQTTRVMFSYAYPDRLSRSAQVLNVIEALKHDPNSRQAYVAMWNAADSERLGYRRVPCSLGWHFMFRGGKLNMTYFMRSCELGTHFQNDVYLAMRLQEYVAEKAGMARGNYTHFISSLHAYKRWLKDVF